MRKIVFYCDPDVSSMYEYPDDVTDEQLDDDAFDWVCNNVCGEWREVDE